jgi:hypothetical protein
MQNGYSLNHLLLNNQRTLWGENRIISMSDPKSEAASTMEVINLENPNSPGEIMPFVKIGNTFTVPFFKK